MTSTGTPKTPTLRKSYAPEVLLSTNNDAAEKENLRQQKQANALFTPFKNAGANKRKSFEPGAGGTPKGGRMDSDKLQALYGDCIKLANENKITQKNAWSMNLLDHIRGLASAQETDFVTAGCTLDAAGKIYSCRVDSVHTETFRVVTGLSRTSNKEGEEENVKEEDEEEKDGAESDEDEGEKKKKKKKERVYERSTTIEANPENLIQKKVETEFTADPLFQKMCAAFDEGGARGLLLNQLPMAPGCTLLIDSAAVTDNTVSKVEADRNNKLVYYDSVDISDLRQELFAMLGVGDDGEVKGALLQKEMIPRTSAFLGIACDSDRSECFDSDNLPPAPAFSATAITSAAVSADAGNEMDNMEANDDDEDNDGAEDEAEAMEQEMLAEIEDDDTPYGGMPEQKVKSAVGRPSLSGDLNELDHYLDFNDDYTYFDKVSVRNWSGPTHWKFKQMKAVNRDDEGVEDDEGEEGEEGTARSQEVISKKAKGGKKAPFFLSLTGPRPDDMAKKLATATAGITLAAAPKGAAAAATPLTLPPDHHYQPDRFFRLFLRPNTCVCSRKQTASMNDHDDNDDDDMGGNDMGDFNEGYDNEPSGWPSAEGVSGGVQMLNQPRKAQKIQIDYARTAKKIDIKALKETLWDQLDGKMSKYSVSDKLTAPPEGSGIKFSETMKHVDGEKFPEVSVSFCFICLLHLANEKSLAIFGDEQQRATLEGTMSAGELSDLRIVSDP